MLTGMVLLAAVPQWLTVWLTPIWILGVGCVAGLTIILAIWGIARLISPVAGKELPLSVREGPLWPIFCVVCLMAIFGVVGLGIADSPREVLSSLARMPQVGKKVYPSFQVTATDTTLEAIEDIKPHVIDVAFDREELQRLEVKSDINVIVSAHDTYRSGSDEMLSVSGGQAFDWTRAEGVLRQFPQRDVNKLYVWNFSDQTANVTVTTFTDLANPEVKAIPITAMGIVGIFGIYMLLQLWVPKVAAVSLATAKSEMAQPLFLISLGLGAFLLLLFIWIPYNTFGEDIKMLKDSGLTLIMILSIFVAVWAGGTSISEELDGRTALTVLSKPISRRQFIIGKFVGIVWVIAVMTIILGILFLLTVAYKPIYDSRESANVDPTWNLCFLEVIHTVPGLLLGFFETVVLAAISVAISTRLPILANFTICSSVYALGHLIEVLVQSSVGKLPMVVFFGKFMAAVLPVLGNFNIQSAIAGGQHVPLNYLAFAFLYCVLYSTMAMLLALALFEDRDLA